MIPDRVEIARNGDAIKVKGPLGETQRDFKPNIDIAISEKFVNLKPKGAGALQVKNRALWGAYASHISNMIEGVTKGFEKKLVIEGIGFKAQLSGTKLSLNLGLSHPVEIGVPAGISVKIDKNLIAVLGIDKEKVGQFSADIRAMKKPEPYKGTGIRYENEVVRKKAGKKAAAVAA